VRLAKTAAQINMTPTKRNAAPKQNREGTAQGDVRYRVPDRKASKIVRIERPPESGGDGDLFTADLGREANRRT